MPDRGNTIDTTVVVVGGGGVCWIDEFFSFSLTMFGGHRMCWPYTTAELLLCVKWLKMSNKKWRCWCCCWRKRENACSNKYEISSFFSRVIVCVFQNDRIDCMRSNDTIPKKKKTHTHIASVDWYGEGPLYGLQQKYKFATVRDRCFNCRAIFKSEAHGKHCAWISKQISMKVSNIRT